MAAVWHQTSASANQPGGVTAVLVVSEGIGVGADSKLRTQSQVCLWGGGSCAVLPEMGEGVGAEWGCCSTGQRPW